MPLLVSLFISFEMISGSLGCSVESELCISKILHSFEKTYTGKQQLYDLAV